MRTTTIFLSTCLLALCACNKEQASRPTPLAPAESAPKTPEEPTMPDDAKPTPPESLQALGMKPFDREQADFTGIANPPSPADRLFISAAFHEAFVKVDEKGTEAAAATAVVMAVAGAAPAQPKEFHADHPFLFAIRDTSPGAILFLGRVVVPS